MQAHELFFESLICLDWIGVAYLDWIRVAYLDWTVVLGWVHCTWIALWMLIFLFQNNGNWVSDLCVVFWAIIINEKHAKIDLLVAIIGK